MKRILPLLLAAAALLGACKDQEEMDAELYEGNDICLKIKSRMIYTFDASSGQLGYNPARNLFRAGNDDMSEYFILTCEPFPAATDMEVTADLTWKTGSTIQHRDGVPMKVMKTDDAGLVWLWSKQDKIGAVVKILN